MTEDEQESYEKQLTYRIMKLIMEIITNNEEEIASIESPTRLTVEISSNLLSQCIIKDLMGIKNEPSPYLLSQAVYMVMKEGIKNIFMSKEFPFKLDNTLNELSENHKKGINLCEIEKYEKEKSFH